MARHGDRRRLSVRIGSCVSKVRCAAGCLLLRHLLESDAHAAACQRPLVGGELGEADGADGSKAGDPRPGWTALKRPVGERLPAFTTLSLVGAAHLHAADAHNVPSLPGQQARRNNWRPRVAELWHQSQLIWRPTIREEPREGACRAAPRGAQCRHTPQHRRTRWPTLTPSARWFPVSISCKA